MAVITMAIVKTRPSDHRGNLMGYETTARGMVTWASLRDYRVVGPGAAAPRDGVRRSGFAQADRRQEAAGEIYRPVARSHE